MRDMEQTRGAELEAWNKRVMVWTPLLIHQPDLGVEISRESWDHLKMLEPGRGCYTLKSGIHRMSEINSRMTSSVSNSKTVEFCKFKRGP